MIIILSSLNGKVIFYYLGLQFITQIDPAARTMVEHAIKELKKNAIIRSYS